MIVLKSPSERAMLIDSGERLSFHIALPIKRKLPHGTQIWER